MFYSSCPNLASILIQIEFKLEKLNSNSTQGLRMIIQTRPNIGLSSNSIESTHPNCITNKNIYYLQQYVYLR